MIRDRITDRSRNTRLVAKPRFTMISACHKPLRYLKADQHTEHCFLTELALYIHALRTEAYHEEQHHKPTAHACEQGLPQKIERIDFFYTLFLCARQRTFLKGESPKSARQWEGYSRTPRVSTARGI